MSHHLANVVRASGEWERVKDVIHDLYLRDNCLLEGAGGLIERMEKDHGFVKSKAQYASQLSRWGFTKRPYRKGIPKRDWQSINLKVEQARKKNKSLAKNERKEITAYLLDQPITDKVLRTQGYLPSSEAASRGAASPQTPLGFDLVVRTPLPSEGYNLPFIDLWEVLRTDFAQHFADSVVPASLTPSQVLTLLKSERLPLSSPAIFPEATKHLTKGTKYPPQEVDLEDGMKRLIYGLSNHHLQDRMGGEEKQLLLDILKSMGLTRFFTFRSVASHPSFKALLESIFELAIEVEDIEIIKWLLQNGMDPNIKLFGHSRGPFTPMEYALETGMFDMARLLIRERASINVDRGSRMYKSWNGAIALAISGWLRKGSGDIESLCQFFNELLDAGAKVSMQELDVTPRDGKHYLGLGHFHSPLTLASKEGLCAIVDLILAMGPPHHPCKEEISLALGWALHECSEYHYRMEVHIKRNCPPFPLFMVDQLLKAGADVNRVVIPPYKGQGKMTPLELASHSYEWSREAAAWLLEHGAQPTINTFKTSVRRRDSWLCTHLLSIASKQLLRQHTVCELAVDSFGKSNVSWLLNNVDESTRLRVSDHDICCEACVHSVAATGAIHKAIVMNDHPRARDLIKKGYDVNDIAHYNGVPETALSAAIRSGDRVLVNELVENGAKFEIETGQCCCGHSSQTNVLNVAVKYGDEELICDLVSKGADLTCYGLSYNTRHKVLRTGLTITAPGDLQDHSHHICDCGCISPLAEYLYDGHDIQRVEMLLRLGATPDHPSPPAPQRPYHVSPLAALFMSNHLDGRFRPLATALLLSAGANPFDTDALINMGTHIFWVNFQTRRMVKSRKLITGEREAAGLVLKRILSLPAPSTLTPEVTLAETAALIGAVQIMNIDCVTAILERRIALNEICPLPTTLSGEWRRECIFINNVLQMAALWGHVKVVHLLLEHGVDVNAAGSADNGATALQFALKEEHFDVAELLIKHGADVNAPPAPVNGLTCLQIVARQGNLGWVKKLVREGAAVNAMPLQRHKFRATALQYAVQNGCLKMVRYLVEHEADVNQEPAPLAGATAIQFAAMHGFIAIAQFLLRHGANVLASPAETEGRTALEGASEHGRIDMVSLLLHHIHELPNGIEPRQVMGKACDLAEKNCHYAIRDMLVEHFGNLEGIEEGSHFGGIEDGNHFGDVGIPEDIDHDFAGLRGIIEVPDGFVDLDDYFASLS